MFNMYIIINKIKIIIYRYNMIYFNKLINNKYNLLNNNYIKII